MDKKTVKTVVITLIATAAAGLILFFGILYSGIVSIAASKPHFALTKWILETGMESSVERQAAKIKVPAQFTEEEVRSGFDHYREMCEICHGAPGVKRTEIAEGMRPKPPDLAKVARELKDAETYWIVSHGIKFTGMPGFGNTHDERELWGIVAFVRRLPDLSPEAYRKLKQEEAHDDHHH